MSLRAIHIDGYGHFAQQTFEFVPGMNLLYGPNEAGKSTLLRFIRFVLFDRRRRRGGLPVDVALAGGRLGGALVLDTHEGPLRIARTRDRMTVSVDGLPAHKQVFEAFRGGFDRDSFNAVFACELDDLAGLAALDDQQLRGRLFASSVVGGGTDVSSCLAEWKDEISNLGARKSTGTLKTIRKELHAAKKRLATAESESSQVPTLAAHLRRLEADIARANACRATARDRTNVLASIEQALPHWLEVQRTAEWLSARSQPARSVEAWADIHDRLRDAQQQVRTATTAEAAVDAELNDARDRVDELASDPALVAAQVRLGDLHRRHGPLPDLAASRIKAERVASELREALTRVGASDVAALRSIRVDPLSIRSLEELAGAVPALPADPTHEEAQEQSRAAKEGREQATAALEQCPPAGPALAVRSRLSGITFAETRAREITEELRLKRAEANTVTADIRGLEQPWDGLLVPVDPRAVDQAAADLQRYSDHEVVRAADLKTLRDRLHELATEVQQHETPIVTPDVSAMAIDWAESREEMARTQRRAAALDLAIETAAKALEDDLRGRPWIDSRAKLESVHTLPWSQIHQVALEVQRLEAAVPEIPTGAPDPTLPPDSVVDVARRRDQALELYGDVAAHSGAATAIPVLGVGLLLALILALIVGLWLGTHTLAAVLGGVVIVALCTLFGLLAWRWVSARAIQAQAADLGLTEPDPAALQALVLECESTLTLTQRDSLRPDLATQGHLRAQALSAVNDAMTRLSAAFGPVVPPPDLPHGALIDVATNMTRWAARLDEQIDRQIERDTCHACVQDWLARSADVAVELGRSIPQTFANGLELAQAVTELRAARVTAQAQEKERNRALEVAQTRHEGARAQLARFDAPDDPLREATEASWAALSIHGVQPQHRRRWLSDHKAIAPLWDRHQRLTDELERLTINLHDHQAEIDRALGEASVDTFDKLAQAVETAVRQDALHTDAKGRLEAAERAVQDREIAAARCAKRVTERRERVDAFESAARRLRWGDVRPEGVETFAARLEAANDRATEHLAIEAEIRHHQTLHEQWFQEVIDAAKTLGSSPPNRDEAPGWLRERVEAAQEAGRDASRKQERVEHVDALQDKRRTIQLTRQSAERQVTAILDEASVQTPEEVQTALQRAQDWERHEHRRETAHSAMMAAMGRWAADWKRHLAEQDPDDLSAEQLKAAQDAEHWEATHAALTEERGAVQNQLDTLERVADVIEASSSVEILEEREAKALEQIAELHLAMSLLEQTYEDYVRQNQPAVLKRASDLLRRSSDGHMVSVRAREDDLWVEAGNGILRKPEQLSRGAREMLYLVIRFALALEHAKRVDLPLILDDVLVNQDPERARGLAAVLREVAQEHQVLLLTCRPEARALIEEVVAETKVIELTRYGGRDAPVAPTTEQERPRRTGDDHTDRVSGRASEHLELVLEHLRQADTKQAKGDILHAIELSAGQWPAVLDGLKAHVHVEVTGAKRGTRYRWMEEEGVAAEENAVPHEPPVMTPVSPRTPAPPMPR